MALTHGLRDWDKVAGNLGGGRSLGNIRRGRLYGFGRSVRRRAVTPVAAQIECCEPRVVLSASMSLPTAAVSVPEDATVAGDAAIASFSITDIDWISISAGDPNGHFYVNIDSPDTATLYVSSMSPLNYESTSSFSLTLDGWNMADPGDIASGTLAISVTDVDGSGVGTGASNDPPMALDDDLWTAFHTPLSASAAELLSNDFDLDDTDLQVRIVSLPSAGVLMRSDETLLNAGDVLDGSFMYVPNPMFLGDDAFQYVASDGNADSAAATVNIHVEADNPWGAVDIDVDSNNDGTINATDDTIEESEAKFIYIVPDQPFDPGIDADFAEFFDPAEFEAEEDLGEIILSFTPLPGVNPAGLVLRFTFTAGIRVWADNSFTTEVFNGAEFTLSSGSFSMTLYAEGTSPGAGDASLELIDPSDPTLFTLADDVAKIKTEANVPIATEVVPAEQIAVGRILDDATLTDTEKADAINASIAAAFHSTGAYGAAPLDAVPDPLPDKGYIQSSKITAVMVSKFTDGSLLGYSGWTMGWKVNGKATSGFAYDLSSASVRFMGWYMVATSPPVADMPRIAIDRLGTVSIPGLSVAQHELAHINGVKKPFRTELLAAGAVFTNTDEAGKLPIKVGFVNQFKREVTGMNEAVAELRFAPTVAIPVLTDDIAKEKARSLIKTWFTSKKGDIAEAGHWHDEIVTINGEKFQIYRGAP